MAMKAPKIMNYFFTLVHFKHFYNSITVIPKKNQGNVRISSQITSSARTAIVLSAGKEHTFELKPFEVRVFDATLFKVV